MPHYVITTSFSFLVNTDEADEVDKEFIDFSDPAAAAKHWGGKDALQDMYFLVGEPIASARLATPEEITAQVEDTAAFAKYLQSVKLK